MKRIIDREQLDDYIIVVNHRTFFPSDELMLPGRRWTLTWLEIPPTDAFPFGFLYKFSWHFSSYPDAQYYAYLISVDLMSIVCPCMSRRRRRNFGRAMVAQNR